MITFQFTIGIVYDDGYYSNLRLWVIQSTIMDNRINDYGFIGHQSTFKGDCMPLIYDYGRI